MAKGDVYFHDKFPFHDGEVGNKFFVVINEPSEKEGEPFLVLKTTSNLREKKFNIGCNEKQKVFFIPSKNAKVFPKNTLIQLHEIYEFTSDEFANGVHVERIISFKESLNALLISQLINCIKRFKDDISIRHFRLITNK